MKKPKIISVKYYAYQLRSNYQIPYQIVSYVDRLNKDSNIAYIRWLIALCEEYMRVNGYYKKYPQKEQEYNEVIKLAYIKMWTRKDN